MKHLSTDVDGLALSLRQRLVDLKRRRVLIADLRGSIQARDVHLVNCGGVGRVWHKEVNPSEGWNDVPVPHYPASWRLGIPVEEASYIQVFQLAGCNYRCWYCYVDYHLLNATPKWSRFFSAEELIALWQKESLRPRVIRLSGGQPDLVPEWVPWMMEAMIEVGIDGETYLWVDDNLSGYYAWRFLTEEEWDLILNYPNFGRIGTIKGIDPESFHYNTGAPPEHFFRQIDLLGRWVKSGVDQYAYLILTTPNVEKAPERIEKLLDLLQEIHPNLPLRVFPQRIRRYSPTISRLTPEREETLYNQGLVLDLWNQSLRRRFDEHLLSLPCYAVDVGQRHSALLPEDERKDEL